MSRSLHFLSVLCLAGLLFLVGGRGSKAQTMTSAEANNHIDETATVCGKVVASRMSKYEVTSRGKPTFLELDKLEPVPAFMIVTWVEKAQSGQSETAYQGKQVCVTGKLVKFQGIPQIIAPKPSQLSVQSDEKGEEKK